MDVEELDAPLEPVRQFFSGHQCAGDPAGAADLFDRISDDAAFRRRTSASSATGYMASVTELETSPMT